MEMISHESGLILDARHFISRVVNDELTKLTNHETTIEQFNYLIDALERQKFVEQHNTFFPNIRAFAKQLHDGTAQSSD